MNTSASTNTFREGQTLQLFEDLAVNGDSGKIRQRRLDCEFEPRRSGVQHSGVQHSGVKASGVKASGVKKWHRLPRRLRASDVERSDPHLKAARRLSRAILRLPQNSNAKTQAGIAICRHLIASLDESH